MSRSRGKPPGQRQLRVGEELRHVLAQVLNAGHAHDPLLRGASITVTEVRVSSDLKNATVFVLPLGGHDGDTLVRALRHADSYFRREVARAANLRFTPRLSFELDRSFDTADRIEAALRSERVRRDLDAADEETGDGSPR